MADVTTPDPPPPPRMPARKALFLVGALGLGSFISAAVKSQVLATQIAILSTYLPAVLLSGFIFQIRSMPVVLQVVTYAIPARYYLVILRGVIIKGSDLGPYWDQMAGLALFAVATLGLATLRLIREEA